MKPSIKKFREAAARCGGNISAIAAMFGVFRSTVYKWMRDDVNFSEAVEEHRGRLLDRCLKTAELLANGVPEIEDTPGGPKFAGWRVQPDGYMLRYLISTLGRREGFGDSLDVTSNGEAIKQEPIRIEVIDRRGQIEQSQTTDSIEV